MCVCVRRHALTRLEAGGCQLGRADQGPVCICCMCVCVCVWRHAWTGPPRRLEAWGSQLGRAVCVYVCLYVCVCICRNVCLMRVEGHA